MNRWILAPILCILLIGMIYAACIPASAFLIDDVSLIQIPQILAHMDFQLLRTLFTPGFHVDFYPVRDLAYWVEIHLFNADVQCVDMTVYRIFNFAFFFGILLFLGRILNRRMSSRWGVFLSILIYGLHPIHAESLLWASAQKDLLALLFGLAAADQVDLMMLMRKPPLRFTLHASSAVLFFVLSLMSKSSLSLLPLAFVFFIFNRRDSLSEPKKGGILITGALLVFAGFFWSFLQFKIYTDVNEMRLNYPFSYRIQASAAALGKELVGLLYTKANLVDVENWGSWLSQNRVFVPLGIMAWLVFAVSGGWALFKNRSTRAIALLLGGFLLYLPTAGLLFPHRNFYSVRYLEPVLLYAWVFLSPQAEVWVLRRCKVREIQIATLALFSLLLTGSVLESETWARTENVFLKGLSLHPESLMLKRQLSASFAEDRRWGRLSKAEMQYEDEIDQEVRKVCLSESNDNLNDCASVWASIFLNPETEDDTTLKIAQSRFYTFIKTFLPERLPRLMARQRIIELSVGVGDRTSLDLARDVKLSGLEALPDGRMRIVAAYCFLGEDNQALGIRANYLSNHLMHPLQMKIFSSDLIRRVVRRQSLDQKSLERYRNCLRRAAQYSTL